MHLNTNKYYDCPLCIDCWPGPSNRKARTGNLSRKQDRKEKNRKQDKTRIANSKNKFPVFFLVHSCEQVSCFWPNFHFLIKLFSNFRCNFKNKMKYFSNFVNKIVFFEWKCAKIRFFPVFSSKKNRKINKTKTGKKPETRQDRTRIVFNF